MSRINIVNSSTLFAEAKAKLDMIVPFKEMSFFDSYSFQLFDIDNKYIDDSDRTAFVRAKNNIMFELREFAFALRGQYLEDLPQEMKDKIMLIPHKMFSIFYFYIHATEGEYLKESQQHFGSQAMCQAFVNQYSKELEECYIDMNLIMDKMRWNTAKLREEISIIYRIIKDRLSLKFVYNH